MTVWQIYKSRFLATQGFILLACVILFFLRRNLALTLITFLFLQLAAVYGSWMGKRMVEQLEAQHRMFDERDTK